MSRKHTHTHALLGACCRAIRHFCTFSPRCRHRPTSLAIRGSAAQKLHLFSCSCRNSPLTRVHGFYRTIGVSPARADDWAGPWRSGSLLQIKCRHLLVVAPPEVRAIRSRLPRLRDSVNVASCNDHSLVTAYCISAQRQTRFFFFFDNLHSVKKVFASPPSSSALMNSSVNNSQ